MTDQRISFAQNGEDIVLWRALGDISEGCYLEIGANDPELYSISKLFYDNGWSGVTVEPVAEFADRHRAQRQRDTLIEAAITDTGAETVTFHQLADTGLSTLEDDIAAEHAEHGYTVTDVTVQAMPLQRIVDEHLAGKDVHFCCIDVEGGELAVLRSVDWTTFRPWVLVVEATRPLSVIDVHDRWESILTAANYEFCLFDGISRFYVAAEHADDLRAKLSYASCVLDDFATTEVRDLREQVELARNHGSVMQERFSEAESSLTSAREKVAELERNQEVLRGQLLYWRNKVVTFWASAASATAQGGPPSDHHYEELQRMRETVSWRVTAPLRVVRRFTKRG